MLRISVLSKQKKFISENKICGEEFWWGKRSVNVRCTSSPRQDVGDGYIEQKQMWAAEAAHIFTSDSYLQHLAYTFV